MPNEQGIERRSRVKTWLKRIGVGGFLFFLIKGLLWLIVPVLLTILGRGSMR